MKIYGDTSTFTNFTKEQTCLGEIDVVKAPKESSHRYTTSIFGTSYQHITHEPTILLHIPNSFWSTVTFKLREYLLPWRWKTAYLESTNGVELRKILVCNSANQGELPKSLKKILGRSIFVLNLINNKRYFEVFDQEFLRFDEKFLRYTQVNHPLGEWYGTCSSSHILFHMYRPRNLFSFFNYHLLKNFSNDWKEVSIKAGSVVERVLIEKSDEEEIHKYNQTTTSVQIYKK